MKALVNGGVDDTRGVYRVDAVHDVESASLANGVVTVGDTATTARVGDIFRAEDGPLAGIEIPILSVSTNSFTIATITLPVVTNSFYLLRKATERTDSTGATFITGSVTTSTTVNTAGSVVNGSLTTTTASAEAAPANTVGFLLEAPSTNTDPIRYRIGGTASTSAGVLMEPGRDTGYIPLAATISICATVSGTNKYEILWVKTS